MSTTASLLLLLLWTQMIAVCLGEAETTGDSVHRGELIEAATSGLARCAALHEEKETIACLGHSAVSSDFVPEVGVISLPERSGWDSHFYGTSGTVASCMCLAAENIPLRSIDIIRCAAATYHLCVLITELRRQLQHSL